MEHIVMLKEDMESTGSWLFRWRSYVPLGLVLVLFISLHGFAYPYGSHTLDLCWDFICLTISLAGLCIRIFTIGFVPRDTSGRNVKGQVATSLNTTGLYSVMRHPLYFGNFWIWFGISLFPRMWWVPLIAMFAFVIVYERIMLAEERFLSEKFGDVYREWASSTPVIWPAFRNWQPPSLSFSWKAVLRRENATLFGIICTFWVLELVAEPIAQGRFTIDRVWTAIFLVALCLYVLLRVLKKMKLLNSSGR